MAWDINWGLSKTPDFVGNAIRYSAAGREDRRAREADAAAAQQNAIRLRASEMYAGGDKTGARRFAVGNGQFETAAQFDKLGEADRAEDAARKAKAADILTAIKGAPYDQRRSAIQQYRNDLISVGYQPDMIDAFDPTDDALQVRLDEARGSKAATDQRQWQMDYDAGRDDEDWDRQHQGRVQTEAERAHRAAEETARRNAATSAFSAQTGRLSYDARKKAGGFGTPGVGGVLGPTLDPDEWEIQ